MNRRWRIADGGWNGRGPARSALPSAIAAASLAVLGVLASPAAGVTPAELVAHDLTAQPVNVTALREGQISFFDAERRLRREQADRFIGLRRIGGDSSVADAAATGAARLELVDGQVLTGEWRPAEGGDGSTVSWRSASLGEFDIPLDRVRSIVLTPDAAIEPTQAAEDVVRLRNGDELRGFVSAVETEGLRLEVQGVDQPVTLPLDRVAWLRLSNPPADMPASAGQQLVTFADGSRVLVSGLDLASDQVSFRPAVTNDGRAEAVVLPLDRVRRIDFVGLGWRLVELVDQPRQVTGGGEVFGLVMPPHVSSGMLRLHAPVTVRFDVPEGTIRFAATAELERDAAAASQEPWADMEVIVSPGTPQEQRHRINDATPRADINAPVTSRELTIELDPGVNGPILDRLRLRDAVLLIQRPARDAAEPSSGANH